ncbi:MAG: 50S ribosomal protein L9 [Rhodospirillales bacterium]|nr:50S ribosomal protein L9 [Rhodospirillales bacterium]MDE0378025.1 50S ribosomal protein L9 [Rhodospirillales bacterium]
MEVILLERIEKLGGMGDIVGVKDGYARNFLLPRKKALRATPENMERFEREREALEQLNSDRRDAASSAAIRLEGESIILIRQASDTLQLYGSVSARDIAEAMAERGAEVRRQQVRLDRPIKSLGVHDVRIALHPEVTVTVKVNVARSPEEAEIQARGGTILDEDEDEDAAIEAAPEEDAAEDAGAEASSDDDAAGASDAAAAGEETGDSPDEPQDEGSPTT